jgi:hypothetical protein
VCLVNWELVGPDEWESDEGYVVALGINRYGEEAWLIYTPGRYEKNQDSYNLRNPNALEKAKDWCRRGNDWNCHE